jgi:predicted alpha/beta hydrolase family esterase
MASASSELIISDHDASLERHHMMARIQRRLVAAWLASAILWVAWTWHVQAPGWAVAGLLLLAGGHALFLAAEFGWMHGANRGDPSPRARPADLLRAWLGECWHAPRVFCWRQPFREGAFPARVAGGSGERGVLLLHGFVCNRGLWNAWRRKLDAAGTPTLAISLEPPFGSIEDYAPQIEAAVDALERHAGRAPIVVAHSMGGLALRHWWRQHGNAERIHHAITLGTPHHGTRLAALAVSPNGRQMQIGGAWVRALQEASSLIAPRLTCFYSHCDNIVFPASTATVPGADNRHLMATAHVAMVDHPAPWAELQRRLRT